MCYYGHTMGYKALLLDVDGTLVPVGPHTTTSEKVTFSLNEARKKVCVSIVSGRPLEWLTNLFEKLDLVHPCIINGGSQIIDPKTKEILWERSLRNEDVNSILNIIKNNNTPFIVNDNGKELKNPTDLKFYKPLAMQLSFFDSKEKSDKCIKTLQKISNISAHKFFSWDKDRNYKMEIYITNKEATKQHAAKKLAEILNIKTKEMIGVGDARNDIPLLSECGLCIAMGNADDKLKAIADYIAPSVDEDGVAHVVEKFIMTDIPMEISKKKLSFLQRFNQFIDRIRNH
jgi:HAD superfamily hydrolase (TIGR01484 family)